MAISRMQFLRGRFRSEAPALRPPWALEEDAFLLACERCDACLRACPTQILQPGSGRFPQVDFSKGECTFCGDCVRACPTKALDKTALAQSSPPWAVQAQIGNACLALNHVVCRSCGEACDAQAIRFRPALGGISRPELDVGLCTGCGACFAICPTQAITMALPETSPVMEARS